MQNITEYVFYLELSILHNISSFIQKITTELFLNLRLVFHQFFGSTVDCFKDFSYSKVFALTRNLVYLLLNLFMYSFAIKVATEGNKAVLLEMVIPTLLSIIDSVDEVIVEAGPNKISMKLTVTFFFSNFITSFYNNHYQF